MGHDLHVNPENPVILSIKPSQFLQDDKMGHDLHVNPENPLILSIKPSQFFTGLQNGT